MQAIMTKYLPATDTKPARIKASCSAGSVTIPYDDGKDSACSHEAAAKALCEKLGWVPSIKNHHTPLSSGQLPDGRWVHTFIPEEYHKAAQAVFEVRRAMIEGNLWGNPYCKPWGKMVSSLTDSDQQGPLNKQCHEYHAERCAE